MEAHKKDHFEARKYCYSDDKLVQLVQNLKEAAGNGTEVVAGEVGHTSEESVTVDGHIYRSEDSEA